MLCGIAKPRVLFYNQDMQYGRFATIYDALMDSVDYEAWADYVVSLLPKGTESVVECACGTGSVTQRLARSVNELTATDISDEMLSVAAEKCREAGIGCRRVRFAQMDMRHIALHRPVDAVVCCCDGVNYLTSRADAEAFFNSAYSCLKPNGTLLFDVSSRHKLQNILGDNTFTRTEDDVCYIWQNCYDAQTKLIEMQLTFFQKQGALYERFDETHIQRAHSVRELTSWLEKSGFTVTAMDCFTLNAPNDTSERIQFTARKQI